jgi:peroxin-3
MAKSKKELWRDLRTASISRAITTAILIPLLHLLTVSQLSTLARRRYLEDVKSSLPTPKDPRHHRIKSDDESNLTPRQRQGGVQGGWLHSFSIEGMGLSDFVEESASLLPSSSSLNPLAYLPTAVSSRLPVPAFLRPSAASYASQTPATTDDWTEEYEESDRMRKEQEQAEAERMYLTYSWWILHEGWKGVKEKVDEEVDRVFGSYVPKTMLGVVQMGQY